jgi:hypothetical protein
VILVVLDFKLVIPVELDMCPRQTAVTGPSRSIIIVQIKLVVEMRELNSFSHSRVIPLSFFRDGPPTLKCHRKPFSGFTPSN